MAKSVQKLVAEFAECHVKDLEAVDGPDSGTGVDYWFKHKKTGTVYYANDDQGEVSISVATNEDDI